MTKGEKIEGREYVTLYVVYDDFGRRAPTLQSSEALVCNKTYKFWPFRSEWHQYKVSIRKSSRSVHLTPESALKAYMDQQKECVSRGKLAAARLSQATTMLKEVVLANAKALATELGF